MGLDKKGGKSQASFFFLPLPPPRGKFVLKGLEEGGGGRGEMGEYLYLNSERKMLLYLLREGEKNLLLYRRGAFNNNKKKQTCFFAKKKEQTCFSAKKILVICREGIAAWQ